MLSSGFGDERLALLWHRLQRTTSRARGELGVSQNDVVVGVGEEELESEDVEETDEDALILSTGQTGEGYADGRCGE